MGYRVLVVEDEAVVAVGIRSMIQDGGNEVIGVAHSGEEALKMASEDRPDIALVDIKLPGMNGIETTKKLVKNHGIAVIVLTAYADQEFIDGAAAAGAFTYLLKPADTDALRANLELASARAGEFAVMRKEAEETKSALETRKLAERAKHILMERLTLNEENAFAHLRQKCRNQNKTMRQAAEEIIAADEAFLFVVEKEAIKKDRSPAISG